MPSLRLPKAYSRTSRPRVRDVFAHWSYILTVAASIGAVVAVGLWKPPFLPDLSNLLFDWYQRLDPRPWQGELPVRIVDIDDESLARLGQWPWPRSRMAELVGRLADLDAAAVALDIVFAEPDGSSPEQVIRLLPSSPARILVEQEISARKSNDVMLAEAIARTPTALGMILTQSSGTVDYSAKFGIATAGDDPLPVLPRFTGAVLPLPILSSDAAGIGALNWLPDRDQIVRRVPLVLALGDKIVPSLAVETLRVAQGASTIVVRSSNASGQFAFGAKTGVNSIKIGGIEIATDPQAEIRVRYTRSEPRRFVPAWKVLAGEADRSEMQKHIMVLGTSAAGLSDRQATPVDASVPGTEIQAQVLENLMAGTWLTRPDWLPGAEVALAVLLGLLSGAVLPRLTALPGAFAAAVAIALIAWASRYEFSTHGLLFDPILPGLSIATTYIACVVWLYWNEQRRRRYVREAFGRYVSPAVVARLAEDPAKLVLGGESRTVTILFCDVRGFTSIAERLDAERLTRFMNEYLTPMTDAILARGGTVDKYIGDAVMAFWNAPLDDADHARHAAQAALAMTAELKILNSRWRNHAEARGGVHDDVKFGIGLATGTCCVGNFGSVHRFNYSVLGDAVNLASRLEAATKFYQTDILASEATRALSPDLAWLEVDDVRIRGRTQPARIYTLAGNTIAARPAFVAVADIHQRVLAAYRCGDFTSAVSLAREARGIAPARLRDLYALYERRCCVLEKARPNDWIPITDLAEK